MDAETEAQRLNYLPEVTQLECQHWQSNPGGVVPASVLLPTLQDGFLSEKAPPFTHLPQLKALEPFPILFSPSFPFPVCPFSLLAEYH